MTIASLTWRSVNRNKTFEYFKSAISFAGTNHNPQTLLFGSNDNQNNCINTKLEILAVLLETSIANVCSSASLSLITIRVSGILHVLCSCSDGDTLPVWYFDKSSVEFTSRRSWIHAILDCSPILWLLLEDTDWIVIWSNGVMGIVVGWGDVWIGIHKHTWLYQCSSHCDFACANWKSSLMSYGNDDASMAWLGGVKTGQVSTAWRWKTAFNRAVTWAKTGLEASRASDTGVLTMTCYASAWAWFLDTALDVGGTGAVSWLIVSIGAAVGSWLACSTMSVRKAMIPARYSPSHSLVRARRGQGRSQQRSQDKKWFEHDSKQRQRQSQS